jgi:glucose-6-phosphate-specific signal transduction histidine kinase
MAAARQFRILASFVGFTLVVAGVITGFTLFAFNWPNWQTLLVSAAANVVLTFAIGGLCWAVFPLVAQGTCDWHPFNRWTALLLAMLGAAAGGSAVGVAIARLIGIGGSATALYVDTLRTAAPITLIVGTLAKLLESSKMRLTRAELALRTQQVERERAEKLAAEARLASLSSRVHPHFLFNTLNSIASLIRDNPRQAEEMVERFSSLLRGSLDQRDTVPLEREMKLVADYLDIQRARLGERLRYTIDCPSSTHRWHIPPFAVQSLVENAVKHVAGRRATGVELTIAARADPGQLLIEIADDGPGFQPDAMTAGHGLDILEGRLRAVFGERARLEFERRLDRMTVRLRIAAQ